MPLLMLTSPSPLDDHTIRSTIFFKDPPTTKFYTLSLHDALPILPADARHESAGSFGFDARLIRQHHRDVVFDRIDTPASGTFQALAVGREPDGRLTQGADKDLEQLFAHRHGNLLRANRPTVADANCRMQLPRLTSPLIARVFRPRGSSAKAIYKPRSEERRVGKEGQA